MLEAGSRLGRLDVLDDTPSGPDVDRRGTRDLKSASAPSRDDDVFGRVVHDNMDRVIVLIDPNIVEFMVDYFVSRDLCEGVTSRVLDH